MDNNYRFQFITEYITPRGDFHQCFEVRGVPSCGGSLDEIKEEFIEHIKKLLRFHGCLLTRLWIAYSDLTVDELQEITDGKLPVNSRGQLVTLEEIDL